MQAKVSLQKSGLAGQLLKIKDQYECLVKLIEKMESAKYLPLKKQCKQSKNLTLVIYIYILWLEALILL